MAIDMSAIKAPPAKRGTTSSRSRAAQQVAETRTLNEKRTEGLLGLGQLGQGICLMVGLYADAAAIGQHFPPVAKELANVADTADIVAKPIDFLIEIGPYGALVAAAVPLALQIMANHGMIDATKMVGQGIVPPQVLESQMRAEVARMQAVAMRQQQEAMAEARKAQAEYERLVKEEAGE